MDAQLSRSVWKQYGFRSNPFDTNALSLNTPGVLPDLFVERRRSKEFQLMTNILRSEGGARFVVEGEIGVGKTTFVNYHRYLWFSEAKDRLFTPVQEISILPDWSLRDLLMNILGALILRLHSEKGEKFLASRPVLHEIAMLTKVSCRSYTELQGQVLGFGFGMGRSENTNVPEIPDVQLIAYFMQLVQELRTLGYDGVFLHFDNLELIAARNPDRIRHLLEDIRDVLQIPNVYSAFVGNIGFFGEIVSPLERVRSIFVGFPIQLSPLQEDEVIEVIGRRYQVLSKGHEFVKPFADEFVGYLHRLYQGKIRFIMDALHSIVLRLAGAAPETLPGDKSLSVLQEIMLEKIENSLTSKEKQVLEAAIQHGTFVNGDLAKQLEMPTQNIGRALQRLMQCNFVHPCHKIDRLQYYKVNESLQTLQNSEALRAVAKPRRPPVVSRQKRIVQLLHQRSPLNSKELQIHLGCSFATLRRDLISLIQKRTIKKTGSTRNAYYELQAPQ